jgi:acyl-CoA synthetase (AMP-forming)/AMP-acid ligase II
MHLSSLVEMIEAGYDDRTLLGVGSGAVNGVELGRMVRAGSASLAGSCTALVYVGENHPMLPVGLLSAAWAGVPFVPVNYRLDDERLTGLLGRQPGARVLADLATAERLGRLGHAAEVFDAWLAGLSSGDGAGERVVEPAEDDEQVAIVLYTSGTTAEPKAAYLRHRHLMAYLLDSVEFGGAGPDEAVLVSVPPYHIAGMANALSNLYTGRRLVYLRSFDPHRWLETVRAESVSHAMVVPTMLARIVEALSGEAAQVPSLRSLSYGGSKISERVLTTALEAFESTGFVNAYGLTETASTVAVLGPEDHRAAITSNDPLVRRRLSSVGRLLPAVEIEIRDDAGAALPAGTPGYIYLRGEQIAGEYSSGSVLDADGWFFTRDRGSVDEEGYLFIEGRADDTIIRGGENIAPAEIEAVLLSHADVAEACVVGLPDDEWGQRIVAVVVLAGGATVDPEQLRETVREQLRGSKTPEAIVVRHALPYTETGKLLRRIVLAELIAD